MTIAATPNRLLDRFRQRSGRVVSVSRLALAVIFMLALLFGENLPQADEQTALTVMTIYIGWSVFLVVATWRDWWLDFIMAWPAHLLDILIFGAVVYLTEGYTSPFYIFSVFLILSATLRWSWRQTSLTAAAVVATFLVAGLVALGSDAEPDLARIMLRTTYLIVLSLLLIWFAVTRERPGPVPQPKEYRAPPSEPPAADALSYALTRIPGDLARLVWWDREEPWIHVWEQGAGGLRRERLGPDELADVAEPEQAYQPFLFDLVRERSVSRPEGGRADSGPLPRILLSDRLEEQGHVQGIAVCISSAFFAGQLVIAGGDRFCLDQLSEAADVGVQVSAMFDRYSVLKLSAAGAVNEAKVTLARDLHDGVVQALSGASFRLEALRSWIRAGRDPDAEIAAIQQALAREQQNVRGFIRRLQTGRGSGQPIDLRPGLQELMDQLCANWGIDGALIVEPATIMVPAWMEHSVKQLVREAAANAVRHGEARRIECKIATQADELVLDISDDGKGFALRGRFDEQALREKGLAPWSIYERTKSLGGTVSLFSHPAGSRLQLILPIPEAA